MLVAPGYYRCLNQVPQSRDDDPSEYVTCGFEYPEGPASTRSAVCGCGTFAVGACASCGRWVCGDHSGLFGGRRLCGADYSAAVQRENTIHADASRQAAERWREAIESVPLATLIDWFLYAMGEAGNRFAWRLDYLEEHTPRGFLRPEQTRFSTYPTPVWRMGGLALDYGYLGPGEALATDGSWLLLSSQRVVTLDVKGHTRLHVLELRAYRSPEREQMAVSREHGALDICDTLGGFISASSAAEPGHSRRGAQWPEELPSLAGPPGWREVLRPHE